MEVPNMIDMDTDGCKIYRPYFKNEDELDCFLSLPLSVSQREIVLKSLIDAKQKNMEVNVTETTDISPP